jgi:hypothetical protein
VDFDGRTEGKFTMGKRHIVERARSRLTESRSSARRSFIQDHGHISSLISSSHRLAFALLMFLCTSTSAHYRDDVEMHKILISIVNSGVLQGFRYIATWFPRDCFLFHHFICLDLVDIDTLSLFISYPYTYLLDPCRLYWRKRDGLKWVYLVFGT